MCDEYNEHHLDKCFIKNCEWNINCNCDISCEFCKNWKLHIRNAKLARNKSRSDIDLQFKSIDSETKFPKYLVISVDMQKILSFPKLKKVILHQKYHYIMRLLHN
jgi:hypothetical protein